MLLICAINNHFFTSWCPPYSWPSWGSWAKRRNPHELSVVGLKVATTYDFEGVQNRVKLHSHFLGTYVFSQNSHWYSPLTLARIHHFLSLVFSTHSHRYSPLTLTCIHHFLSLVFSSLPLSSSPLPHARHLQALLLVISWEKTTDPTKGRFLIVFYEYG